MLRWIKRWTLCCGLLCKSSNFWNFRIAIKVWWKAKYFKRVQFTDSSDFVHLQQPYMCQPFPDFSLFTLATSTISYRLKHALSQFGRTLLCVLLKLERTEIKTIHSELFKLNLIQFNCSWFYICSPISMNWKRAITAIYQ